MKADYLEVSLLLLLIPLLSPQGWDYMLLLGAPAFALVLDRWRELGPAGRLPTAAGFALTSFAIFDLLGRGLYSAVMSLALESIAALVIVAIAASLRWRRLA